MAWIVEGRKAMDAEDYAARQAQRRQEAADLAAASAVRSERLRESEPAPQSLDSLLFAEPAPRPPLFAPEPAPIVAEQTAEPVATPAEPTVTAEPVAAAEAPTPRTTRAKRKPKTIEE